MTADQKTLKGCPFCGLPPKLHRWVNHKDEFKHFTVECAYGNCAAQPTTAPFDTDTAAINEWNTRADLVPQGDLEALKREVYKHFFDCTDEDLKDKEETDGDYMHVINEVTDYLAAQGHLHPAPEKPAYTSEDILAVAKKHSNYGDSAEDLVIFGNELLADYKRKALRTTPPAAGEVCDMEAFEAEMEAARIKHGRVKTRDVDIYMLKHAISCCDAWEPKTCLMGNVRAKWLGRMLREHLEAISAVATEGEK